MPKGFSTRLRVARKHKKYTQLELAEMIGVSRTSITNWEKGIRTPNFMKIVNLSNALDVSTDYLLTDLDKPDWVKKREETLRMLDFVLK